MQRMLMAVMAVVVAVAFSAPAFAEDKGKGDEKGKKKDGHVVIYGDDKGKGDEKGKKKDGK